MTTHLLTIASQDEMDAARVLARTVGRHHPDWVTWVLPTGPGSDGQGWFHRVLRPDEAASEAAALLHLLGAGAERVFLLHPASVLIGPLRAAEALLATGPAVLTPRVAEGIGLLALRATEDVRTWLRAWAERGGPMPDPPTGAVVLRHPGYDLSFGDLDRVPLRFDPEGALRVGDGAVRLLHAGGAVPERLPPGWTEPLDLLRWVRAEREDARAAGPDSRRAGYPAWQAREFARGGAEARAAGGRFGAAALAVAVARRLPAPVRRVLRRLRGG